MNRSTAAMGKGTLILTTTGITSQILAFIYRIFLSRMIGSQVLGLYQLIMPVYSVLMSLTAVGLTAAASNLSARYQALGNFKAVKQLIRRCLLLFFLLFLPLSIVVALSSDAISVYLLGDARTRLGIVLLLPCIALTGVENIHKYYFYGSGRVGPPAAVELTEQVIRSAAVLTLLALFLPQSPERTLGLIVTGMVLCEVFSVAALLILFRSHFGGSRALPGHGENSKALNRLIGSVALPIGATSLLANLMGSANSVLIPQRLVAGGMEVAEAMSHFGVLFGMTLPMLFLPTAFIGALSLSLTPRLAEKEALGRDRDIRRYIYKSLKATSVIILPAMALMVVLGPSIGLFLFKEPSSGDFLLPLSVGTALTCYQSVLGACLNGVGRQKSAARNMLISDGVQLIFTYWAVGQPEWGLMGYVVGFIISSALGMLLNWISVYRAAGLTPRLYSWLIAPALAALLTGLCCNLLFAVLTSAGLSAAAKAGACLLFGATLYLSALQAQGVGFFRTPFK